MFTEKELSRFWAKVNKAEEDQCWIFGNPRRKTYKTISVHRGRYLAHRISYMIAYGGFDDELCVCHTCDNPPCVNPKHLFLDTHEGNMRDKIHKDRHFKVYTSEDIAQMKALRESGHTWKAIGKAYGCSLNSAWRLVNGPRGT